MNGIVHKKMVTAKAKTGLPVNTKPKRFNCDQCAKQFKTLEELDQHLIRHKKKIWKCNFCDEEFATRKSFRLHKRQQQDTGKCLSEKDDKTSRRDDGAENISKTNVENSKKQIALETKSGRKVIPKKFADGEEVLRSKSGRLKIIQKLEDFAYDFQQHRRTNEFR